MGYNDDYDGFDFEDEDRDERGPRSPKELRDAQKAASKRAKELEAQVAKLTAQLAQRNLKDVLEEKGLRPGLARVIAREDVDVTDPDAVDAWLNDPANQEDFAFSLDAGTGASSDGGDEISEETDPIAAEFARMQNAAANALPEGKFNEASAALEAATDVKSVQAALDKALRGANS